MVCVTTGGDALGVSVGRSGSWSLDGSSGTGLAVLSGDGCCLSGGATIMVDGGNAPSLVCWTATSVLVGTGSGSGE
jgi:hypothetical protein